MIHRYMILESICDFVVRVFVLFSLAKRLE